jgi:hypothetical protein
LLREEREVTDTKKAPKASKGKVKEKIWRLNYNKKKTINFRWFLAFQYLPWYPGRLLLSPEAYI